MSVLFVQEHQHLLRQVFGGVPRYMRCRERHNPFTQLGKNLFARQRFTGYGNHNIDVERGRSVAQVTILSAPATLRTPATRPIGRSPPPPSFAFRTRFPVPATLRSPDPPSDPLAPPVLPR